MINPVNVTVKFNFHPNSLINNDIINFLDLYLKRDFKKTSILMEIINCKGKAFYTEEMYSTLLTMIASVLRIRRFIVRNFKKYKTAPKYINTLSLNLCPFDHTSIELNIKNNIYTFNIKSIIKLYKYALNNIDEYYYLYSKLPCVKNPYTNIPFTVKEHLILSKHLNEFYFKIKKTPPQYLTDFKNIYFNTEYYGTKYHSKLLFHSLTNYLLKLSKTSLTNEFIYL